MTDRILSLRPLSFRGNLPRSLCGAAFVVGLCLFSGITMLGHLTQGASHGSEAQAPAQQLVRDVVQNEINAQSSDHDDVVPVENSVNFYLACRKAGVPAELHVFEKGPHGVGLDLLDPGVGEWPKLLEEWLRSRGLLSLPKP